MAELGSAGIYVNAWFEVLTMKRIIGCVIVTLLFNQAIVLSDQIVQIQTYTIRPGELFLIDTGLEFSFFEPPLIERKNFIQFDPALGTLQNVEMDIHADVVIDSTLRSFVGTVTIDWTAFAVVGIGFDNQLLEIAPQTAAFTVADSNTGASTIGGTMQLVSILHLSGDSEITLTNTQMTPFIGTGTTPIATVLDLRSAMSPAYPPSLVAGLRSSFHQTPDVEVTITYTYFPSSGHLLGDMDCDGLVSVADIPLFALALANSTQYIDSFPDCHVLDADINGDGIVDGADVQGMVVVLLGG